MNTGCNFTMTKFNGRADFKEKMTKLIYNNVDTISDILIKGAPKQWYRHSRHGYHIQAPASLLWNFIKLLRNIILDLTSFEVPGQLSFFKNVKWIIYTLLCRFFLEWKSKKLITFINALIAYQFKFQYTILYFRNIVKFDIWYKHMIISRRCSCFWRFWNVYLLSRISFLQRSEVGDELLFIDVVIIGVKRTRFWLVEKLIYILRFDNLFWVDEVKMTSVGI